MKIIKVSNWRVTGPLKIGDCVTVMGRDYILEKLEPYVTKRGGESSPLHWHGQCQTCGGEFSFKSGRVRFYPYANCETHRPNAKGVGVGHG
jgi:hypothetical protein